MIVPKKRYFIEALLCILLLGLGRSSSCWYLAPVTAVCGYALVWHLCARMKEKFISALLLFFLANLLHLSWMLSHPYGYIYAVWICTALIFAIPFAALSLFVIRSEKPSFRWTIGIAALFTLLEWSYTLLPCGYSFQTAALHLSWSNLPLQLSSYIGGIGLSFFVYWTNLLVFACLEKKPFFVSLVAIALFPYVLGALLLWHRVDEQTRFDSTHSPLRVALCQMEEPPDIFSRHLSPEALHTQEWLKVFSLLAPLHTGEVDLVILPEGAIPFPAQAPLFDARELPQNWQTSPYAMLSSLDICHLLAWSKKSSLLIGLEGRALDPRSNLRVYNSMYCILPDQKRAARYDKQLLIPFGEYIPNEFFRSWLSLYGIHDSFSAGEEVSLLRTHNAQIAPFICYEETFSSYAVEAARLAPDLLCSVSNDNWFPSIRRDHFELARLRAAEVGKPLVRSCNQGVSAAVDALGRTIKSRGETQEEGNGYIIANVSLYSPNAPFVAIGTNLMAAIFALLAVATLTPMPKKQKHSLLC